jgi:hypothetical protein
MDVTEEGAATGGPPVMHDRPTEEHHAMLVPLASGPGQPTEPNPVEHAMRLFVSLLRRCRAKYERPQSSFWSYISQNRASEDFDGAFWDAFDGQDRVHLGKFAAEKDSAKNSPFNTVMRALMLNQTTLVRLLSSTRRSLSEDKKTVVTETHTRDLASLYSFTYVPRTDVVGLVFEKHCPLQSAKDELVKQAPSIASLKRGAVFTEADLVNKPLFADIPERKNTVVVPVDTGRNGAACSFMVEKHFADGRATYAMTHKFFSSRYMRQVTGQFLSQQFRAEASWATTWGDLTHIHRKAAQRCKEIYRARGGRMPDEDTAEVPEEAKSIFSSLHSFYTRGQEHRAVSFVVTWIYHMACNLFLAHHPGQSLKDMNLVILWGDADDHARSKLKGAAFPCRQLLEELGRYCAVLRVDEYFSSQTCPLCGNNWGKVLSVMAPLLIDAHQLTHTTQLPSNRSA